MLTSTLVQSKKTGILRTTAVDPAIQSLRSHLRQIKADSKASGEDYGAESPSLDVLAEQAVVLFLWMLSLLFRGSQCTIPTAMILRNYPHVHFFI